MQDDAHQVAMGRRRLRRWQCIAAILLLTIFSLSVLQVIQRHRYRSMIFALADSDRAREDELRRVVAEVGRAFELHPSDEADSVQLLCELQRVPEATSSD